MNYLGNFLNKKIKEMQISEREISSRCGISHSYINQIIKGVNPRTGKSISPTLSTFEKLSKGLGISADDLQKIARGFSEEEVFNNEDNKSKFLEELEKKSTKEGVPVGTKKDKVIPWEIWNQIKEAQNFITCLGLDPSEQSDEEWSDLINDIQLIVKLHMAKKQK
ncbi:MAG: helix-turn-helix transcriptional regulator [Candidatus Gastranaerophilales bacterium]|nr:helix-turn-helix transcriptional regulator [Candidatus Gastranaerophilales bacterium]